MIISYIRGGLGNQLYQYAAGRRLAHKLNTELKLDLTWYEKDNMRPYALNFFNITAAIASPEEIAQVKQRSANLGVEPENAVFMPEVLDYPDDIWLYGYWQHEEYFADIADILRREFTLKKSLSSTAQRWKEKILAAECSVSMHFRHGDFIYSPLNQKSPGFYAIPPMDYYYQCLNTLKCENKNITVFIFSDNLQWTKENLVMDVPIEFVEGDNLADIEELYLMSICKHNIIANSTFSWWGAWLNRNPDKKVFMPIAYSDGKKIDPRSLATGNKNSLLDSDRWTRIPFDVNSQPSVTMRPYFSLLLVVNNDAATIKECLGSILGQDYNFWELIIIDNASTDGSGKICRELVQPYENVTFIKLWNKISDGAAYNKAFDLAQGDYVLFLKGNDRLLTNALSTLYLSNEHSRVDVVNSFTWLREDENGDIIISDRNYILKEMVSFQNITDIVRGKVDKPTLFKILASNDGATQIATKMFKRQFLADNKIRFDERDDATQHFTVDAMLNADEWIFMPHVFYVAPKNSN